MSHRPLVLVSGLTVGDYLLWNWSLNTGHDAFALVPGLTVPLLIVCLAWLLAVRLVRLLARSAWLPARRLRIRSSTRAGAHRPRAAAAESASPRPMGTSGHSSGELRATTEVPERAEADDGPPPAGPPARKLAA